MFFHYNDIKREYFTEAPGTETFDFLYCILSLINILLHFCCISIFLSTVKSIGKVFHSPTAKKTSNLHPEPCIIKESIYYQNTAGRGMLSRCMADSAR